MSEPLLIAILGGNTTLLVAVIGFLGVYIRRNGAKPESWNGEERRQGDFAQHINTCPHAFKFEETIDKLRNDITNGLQQVRNEVAQQGTRIDTLIQQERR